MAEIAQILRALGLYTVSLAIAIPNLWLLAKMLRVDRSPYTRKLEIFSAGMLVCLPAAFLEGFLRSHLQGWISDTFAIPIQAAGVIPPEWTWLDNILIVAPVEEGLKALALVFVLFRLRRGERTLGYATAAPIYWAAIVALGFASFENVIYALRMPATGPGTAGFQVIGLRAVTSSLVHMTATSMLGLAVGVRRRYLLPRWLAGTVGLLAAMLIHTGWNVLARLDLGLGGAHVLMQAGVAVVAVSLPPLFAYALGLIDSPAQNGAALAGAPEAPLSEPGVSESDKPTPV